MSSSPDQTSAVETALGHLKSLATIQGEGLGQVMGRAIVLPITTFLASLAGLIVSIFNVPILTLGSLGEGIGGVIGSLFGSVSLILERSGQVSAGNLEIFGILAFVVGLGVVLLGAYLFAQYTEQEETSNFFPFIGGDIPSWIPGIGKSEEGEE